MRGGCPGALHHRLAGEDVYFQTGTDVHGDKIAEAAAAEGETPAVYAERMSAIWRDTWADLGISFDRFIVTTDADHVRAVQHVLQQLWGRGPDRLPASTRASTASVASAS